MSLFITKCITKPLPFNDFLLDNCSHYIAQPKNLPKINFHSITLDMHLKRFLALPHTFNIVIFFNKCLTKRCAKYL